MVDVTGDNTASMAPVALTIATADNGSVAIKQMGEDFQTWNTVTTTAKPGYPNLCSSNPGCRLQARRN